MDLYKIVSTTKTYLFLLLKSYEQCVYEKIHEIGKYVIPREILFTKYLNKNNSIDSNIAKENTDSDNTTVNVFLLDFNAAGIPHLEAISTAINKKIEVYDENELLMCTIGKSRKNPLRVQFHEDKKHYTHLGCREPFACAKGGMCLYNCLSDQIEADPYVLKALALDYLRFTSANYSGLDLCLGGASYTGQGARDASWYLDNCQGIRGHKFPAPGHPRKHASNPNGVGVEAYSFEGRKSGFNSYEDQDFVAHFALDNAKTRERMDSLNSGSVREVVHINERELNLPRIVAAGTWERGERINSFNVGIVTLVLQHHEGKFSNPEAPVFIQTMYPRYP